MNLALSDEQEFLRDAARGALARHKTVEAAREAADGAELPDLWPTAVEAGWPGLLVSEDNGGAGLSPFDAMLVAQECGRVLAGVALLGHVPASYLLDRGGYSRIAEVADGSLRAAYCPARPPGDVLSGWTVDPRRGLARGAAPEVSGDSVTGSVPWVPDAPGAGVFVVIGIENGAPVALAVEGAPVEDVSRYDHTRSLGHVAFDGASGERLDVSAEEIASAWYIAQALIAAESVGTVETGLEMSLEYAKERFTFGRAIGSYQAVKHTLTEVLRLAENAKSLLLYAGWAGEAKADEFPLAASAARSAAGAALDYAARATIGVHGGIGATWEHDAPYLFRRAQLSRRLVGGTHDATDRVAGELLAAAAV
jgi:alkylation response protein AidB-like acyl-CoA dehydrogenase